MDKIIIIGGSAGSFKIVGKLLSSLPANYNHPLIICMHRLRNVRSEYIQALSGTTKIPVKEAFDKEVISSPGAYIAPPNYHLLIEYGYSFCLTIEEPVNHSRPSIDLTMTSAAEVFRENAIGIILSGANSDGANGMKKIKEMGGLTIVQDPNNCDIPAMPQASLNLFQPDYIMDVNSIIKFIIELKEK